MKKKKIGQSTKLERKKETLDFHRSIWELWGVKLKKKEIVEFQGDSNDADSKEN